MIARGVFIVAFVLVASGNMMGVTSTDIQLFEKVEEAISSDNPSLEQTKAAHTVADIVDKNRHKLDKVLPSDLLTRVFEWIRCKHASIRSFGWKIMEVLAGEKKYVEEVVNEGIIDDILSKIKKATGKEERFIFDTLSTLISMGKYRDNSEFLRKDIIPLLKSQVAHEKSSVAIGGARSLCNIVEHNDESILMHLLESDVARIIIDQIGKRSDLDTERDTALLNLVRSMADTAGRSSRSADFKAAIAKLDFMARINESLGKHTKSYPDGWLHASCLLAISELVESVEAAMSLIRQGLPKFVNDCINHPKLQVKEQAALVLYEIRREPELEESFRLGGSYSVDQLLTSYYKYINDGDYDER